MVGASERNLWGDCWAASSAAGTKFSCPEKARARISALFWDVIAFFLSFLGKCAGGEVIW